MTTDLPGLLPASLTFAFRRASSRPYTITVTLAELALSVFQDFGGADIVSGTGDKVLQAWPIALGGDTPANAAELQTYAEQAATDWYLWRLSKTAQTFAGLVPWEPDGLADRIVWTMQPPLTRVVPWAFNDLSWDIRPDRTIADVDLTETKTGWDLPDVDVVRVTPDASDYDIQGIAGGYDGARRILWNVGTDSFVLAHNSGSAAETHYKLLCDGGADLLVPPNGRAVLEYFAAEASDDGRWRATITTQQLSTTCDVGREIYTEIYRCEDCRLNVYRIRWTEIIDEATGCKQWVQGDPVFIRDEGFMDCGGAYVEPDPYDPDDPYDPWDPGTPCTGTIRTTTEYRFEPQNDGTVYVWGTPVTWEYNKGCVRAVPGEEYLAYTLGNNITIINNHLYQFINNQWIWIGYIGCCDPYDPYYPDPPPKPDPDPVCPPDAACASCLGGDAFEVYTFDLTGLLSSVSPCSADCTDILAVEWTLVQVEADGCSWKSALFNFCNKTDLYWELGVTAISEVPEDGNAAVLVLRDATGIYAQYKTTDWDCVSELTLTRGPIVSWLCGGDAKWPATITLTPVCTAPTEIDSGACCGGTMWDTMKVTVVSKSGFYDCLPDSWFLLWNNVDSWNSGVYGVPYYIDVCDFLTAGDPVPFDMTLSCPSDYFPILSTNGFASGATYNLKTCDYMGTGLARIEVVFNYSGDAYNPSGSCELLIEEFSG